MNVSRNISDFGGRRTWGRASPSVLGPLRGWRAQKVASPTDPYEWFCKIDVNNKISPRQITSSYFGFLVSFLGFPTFSLLYSSIFHLFFRFFFPVFFRLYYFRRRTTGTYEMSRLHQTNEFCYVQNKHYRSLVHLVH